MMPIAHIHSQRGSLRIRSGVRAGLARCVSVALMTSMVAPALHAQRASERLSVMTRLDSSEAVAGTPQQIQLLVGRSTLINAGTAIGRFAVTVPDIADAVVTSPRQLLVHGKAPGKITLFVWDHAEAVSSYEVVVRRDLTELTNQMTQLFPGEPIDVSVNGKDVVLAGTVSSKYVVDKAADVAAGFVEKKENVVNLLHQQEGMASTQIMLSVRFAEVSRSAMQELGVNLFSDGRDNRFGRVGTQQFPTPSFDQKSADLGKSLVFSDYLNLFLFDAKNKLGAVVKALQNKGLFQSLAEPNLIAQNGKEASFLAGGEYPYPAVQGVAGAQSVTIVFKEFGIRLNFIPTVLRDDVIHLKVRPEVSSLDFGNSVSFEGFRVPSLTTRRADTEVELRDGQTFAIAGLLSNNLTESMQKIPGIGDIPILGLLFRSRALQKSETELVVMITPHIMRPNSPGAAPALPSLDKPFMSRPKDTIPPPPAPSFGVMQLAAPPAQPSAAAQPPSSDPSAWVPIDPSTAPAAAGPPLEDVGSPLDSGAVPERLPKKDPQ